MEIYANNTFELWKKLLREVMKHGVDYTDGDGRQCREILNGMFCIKKPVNDITMPIEYLHNFDRWVYPDVSEIKDIILQTNANYSFLYVYGQRIFNYDNFLDQINDFIIPQLRKNAQTRRAIVSLWNPLKDSKLMNPETPSLLVIFFRQKDKFLDLTFNIRSCEMFFGWPANIYQMYVIQEKVASELGLSVGRLTTFAFSAHMFLENLENMRKIIDR